jgi:hypothetical protein
MMLDGTDIRSGRCAKVLKDIRPLGWYAYIGILGVTREEPRSERRYQGAVPHTTVILPSLLSAVRLGDVSLAQNVMSYLVNVVHWCYCIIHGSNLLCGLPLEMVLPCAITSVFLPLGISDADSITHTYLS